MHAGALRAVEFDRITSVLAGLSVTPAGEARLLMLEPLTEPGQVAAALRATSEGVRFSTEHQGFPLRAPIDLAMILAGLDIEGRPLEPLHLIGLADYLESVDQCRLSISRHSASFPALAGIVATMDSFTREIALVRRQIDPAGMVMDSASPALASIRDRLRRQKTKLRSTLEGYLREQSTSKYLQEQVVTDRNGRYVLMVRSEHRQSIPGVVHGASASGASLFLEPLGTVDINNDIVALEEAEHEEVRRILLALTDQFRGRPDELSHVLDVATELDVIQAKARLSGLMNAIEPALSRDGAFEFKAARHPLLMSAVNKCFPEDERRHSAVEPVPVDVVLSPPDRVLVITGPNTGGKTVAIKATGLLVAMAQAGLHIPVDPGSKMPVFTTLLADIGDQQSIAANLSTFSGHVANLVAMDEALELPSLVLLDEIGAGTDPAEGGALGTAVIDRFRQRGAYLIATTHYDSLKSYASTTPGVRSAAFGFNPDTFAPTYRLIYGSPGRSLAIEIAARLGMPASVIAAARENLGERELQLADHLARLDENLRALEEDRKTVAHDRSQLAERERRILAREAAVRKREEESKQKLKEQLNARLREARLEIDAVVGVLKTHTSTLKGHPTSLNSGEVGRIRNEARGAIEGIVQGVEEAAAPAPPPPPLHDAARPSLKVAVGARVIVGGLGLEGIITNLQGSQAEVEVRGKRMRAAVNTLQVVHVPSAKDAPSAVKLNVDLQPREGSLSELNVIGCTVDEATDRVERFLDESMVTDQHTLRLVHGHGTGQLRRAIAALLKKHPLVSTYETAPPNQGGGGVTIVELKD